MKALLTLTACVTLLTVAPATTPASENCLTAECHVDLTKGKHLHGPVAAGECSICHVRGPDDRPPRHHDLTLFKTDKELCLDCHETLKNDLKNRYVHGPIAEGRCTGCHDPHQSQDRFLLVKKNLADMCFGCHENTMTNQKYVHGPVAAGDCIVCHNPHASSHEYLLSSSRINLCLTCHDKTSAGLEKKYIHQPVQESCENCHTPHSSQYPFHLKHDTHSLCMACHQEFVRELNNSSSKHTAIKKNGCLGCHRPHSSDFPKGLRTDKKALCLGCHKDMQAKILYSQYLHGPVQEGDCVACHNPHATDYAKHLVQYFPPQFYMPYKIENYSICFGCHNKEIATEASTETLTDFRNGSQNLHYLHVHRKKGRSCKACHEIHAGNQPKHIASEVPFGESDWMLPIVYTKTETGGGCVVGCHKEKKYDRATPVRYDGQQP